jgi:TolB protein
VQSFPNNPYIPDQPAREPTSFFGRADGLSWISAHLTQHSIAVIHGVPRIGVSSLLLQIGRLLGDRFQAAYILLSDVSAAAAMQQVTRAVAAALGLQPTDSPEALRQALADSIYDTQRRPVLIVLDGLSSWELRTKTDLLIALGALASRSAHIRFVMSWGLLEDETITRDMPLRLIGLTENLAPVAQMKLGPLNRLESSELISGTARDLLKYDFNALERILHEANGRPLVLQMLGFAVYERRALSGRVSARDIEQAIDDAVARLAGAMGEQWQQLTREEQLTLAAAATVRGEHGLLTDVSLVKELQANRFELTSAEAETALTSLAEMDIVESAGVNAYRFSSGLVRDWAIQYANLAAVTGTAPKMSLLPGRRPGLSLGARMLRVMSWILLLAFVGFIFMGGASLVQSIASPPTPTASASLFATPTRTPIPLPTVTPVPKVSIAYTFRKTDKDKWRIYVAGQDGSNATPLTDGLADDEWPSWSPDGAKVAFTSNRDGHWEIYVMNADGSGQTRLTRTPQHNWSPTWSFDGKKLLFSSFRDRNWEVYMANADGSNPTRLTDDPAEDQAPSWSPDGRAIAFASKRTGSYELYLMNPDGSAVTQLTQTNANNYSPAWSPDSRHIAFESNRDAHWQIYLMDGDGSNVKNLSNTTSNDQAPSWSSDGQWIAFQSNREGHGDLWVMRPDGSDASNWTHGQGFVLTPAWRPLKN